ncbi:MAG: phage tail protein, partial [Planctomycetia bacterium]
KAPKAQAAQRQASVLELTLGESPREAVFGRAATGGTLIDAFNYGADYEWEAQVIAVADHACDALEGVFVNDTYHAFSADGAVSGFSGCLEFYWSSGALSATASALLVANGAGRWTGADTATGMSVLIAAYKVSDEVWPSGRPSFRPVVRGLKIYDPRLDSTVPGGSGAHRFSDPATHAWTANAALCRYHYLRGVYSNGQLIVGPGRSADEAPPELEIGPANACDEAVSLKAGGTEPRYRVGGVVRADEAWRDVDEDFCAAMAGDPVDRAGAWCVEVGVSKSSAATITDDDLVFDQPVELRPKLTRRELVNTVIASWVDPGRLWQSVAAPVRRSAEDITADGEVRERSLSLRFVTSGTQAQRCAEITRRMARQQRRATVTLGPRWQTLEAGDWIQWTSARYFSGESRQFRVAAVSISEIGLTTAALQEISSTVFSWTPATDEIDPSAPAYLAPGALTAATVSGFTATSVSITGAGASRVPAVALAWTPPVDASVVALVIE